MASHYSLEQRFSLVLDCYKSGLSIPSWCKEKGIAPGTFYGWQSVFTGCPTYNSTYWRCNC